METERSVIEEEDYEDDSECETQHQLHPEEESKDESLD